MKVCPVCKAVAFDDASVCYGCLYRFGENESEEEGAALAAETAEAACSDLPGGDGRAPAFLIRFTPMAADSGEVTWSCVVEPQVALA